MRLLKYKVPDFAVDTTMVLAVVLKEMYKCLCVSRVCDALSEQFPLANDGVVLGGDVL